MHDQTTRGGLLAAFAQQPSFTAVPMLASLYEGAHTVTAELVCDLAERSLRPRNAGQFTPRKAGRAFRAVLPAWMPAVFTVCLVIPGPFDEAVAGLAALVLLVVRFPRARSAWRGGKSHRGYEARKAAGR